MMIITPKNARLIVGSGLILAFSSGAIAGYFFAKKKLEYEFEKLLTEEIQDAKAYYSRLNKTGPYSDPISALAEALESEGSEEVVDILRYRSEDSDEVIEAEMAEADSADWDYEEELKHRTEETPYIIHYDEFFEGEKDYLQGTLTYFEGDDTLVDERDEPIIDVDNTVGDANLQRFGHGSRDNNILYIRNDKLDMDFEIVRNNKKYTEEILGVMEHSDKPGLHKFRRDDG